MTTTKNSNDNALDAFLNASFRVWDSWYTSHSKTKVVSVGCVSFLQPFNKVTILNELKSKLAYCDVSDIRFHGGRRFSFFVPEVVANVVQLTKLFGCSYKFFRQDGVGDPV